MLAKTELPFAYFPEIARAEFHIQQHQREVVWRYLLPLGRRRLAVSGRGSEAVFTPCDWLVDDPQNDKAARLRFDVNGN